MVLDALGLDADQIEIPTPRYGKENVYVMHSLRGRLEAAASMYLARSAAKRYSLRRDELVALRQKAENWRVEIRDALAIPIPSKLVEARIISSGVDVSMLTETDDYFRKLLLTLDRLSEQAGPRSGNARKTARDHCWNELLAIWCHLGGETTGEAAANFLIAASKPVMRSAVPGLASVLRWLRRRQNKTGNKVTKPG